MHSVPLKSWLFRNYQRLMVNRPPRKHKATPAGKLVFNGMVLTALAGLNTNTSVIYQLFSLLFCFYLAARLGLMLETRKVKIQRHLPRYGTVGTELNYDLTLKNLSTKPIENIIVYDNPESRSPNLNQFLTSTEPFEETRNAYDRFIGFHRFQYLLRQLTGIEPQPTEIALIEPSSTIQIKQTATLLKRGRFTFIGTTVMLPETFNLFFRLLHTSETSSITVLPRIYALSKNFTERRKNTKRSQDNLRSNQSFNSPRGRGDEFFSMREYQAGDALRNIHWASTAKRNKPIVIEYQDESSPRFATALLLSKSKPDLAEQAISVCASILTELEASGLSGPLYYDKFGPSFESGKLQTQLETLALFNPEDQTSGLNEFIQYIEQALTEVETLYLIQTGEQTTSIETAEKLSRYGKRLSCVYLSDATDVSYQLEETATFNHYTIPIAQLEEKLTCL